MESALSFARRALACKEDTELLALCAQVTSRLKSLSQLKWDSQATEKIEINAVTWRDETYNVFVGTIFTLVSAPTQPTCRPSTFTHGHSVLFIVMTSFADALNTFRLGDNHNLELSGSARCSGSIEVRNTGYYQSTLTKSFTENVAVQVTESQNEWRISFSPPYETTSITLCLTASGQYGYEPVTTELKLSLYNSEFP